jgi:predicted PurR-regulated permease PerM
MQTVILLNFTLTLICLVLLFQVLRLLRVVTAKAQELEETVETLTVALPQLQLQIQQGHDKLLAFQQARQVIGSALQQLPKIYRFLCNRRRREKDKTK